LSKTPLIHPVILSGGAGSRLWPVSRHLKPKQFHSVASDKTMFAETIARIDDARFAAPMVLCNEDHRFLVAEEFRAANIQSGSIILEPAPRNTAPAIAAAALIISKSDPNTLMVALSSDHVISDVPAFHACVDRAAKAAVNGQLVTFGILPTRPETGYGYIQAGKPLEGQDDAFHVSRFIEKPDQQTAQQYLDAGTYYWNSGMFLFRAADFLAELEVHAPGVLENCKKATDQMTELNGFYSLQQKAFELAPSISVDYAVMEKTTRATVIPSSIGWSDVGSWMSLHQLETPDGNGNVSVGDIVLYETKNSYIRTDTQLVTAIGVENMIVVATDDAILIAPADRDQDVRFAVDTLKQQGRSQAVAHSDAIRPWGSYKNLQVGDDFLVKEINVRPGVQLSLQYHNHRAEHWVVVEGTARVTNGDDVFDLKANQSTYIPVRVVHRLENIGTTPLRLIEVQTGDLISEEDIVRVEDDFGRT
jgi:mannose-1-phosphate guanylyltransferase/mannose-6-phosphate isomerase